MATLLQSLCAWWRRHFSREARLLRAVVRHRQVANGVRLAQIYRIRRARDYHDEGRFLYDPATHHLTLSLDLAYEYLRQPDGIIPLLGDIAHWVSYTQHESRWQKHLKGVGDRAEQQLLALLPSSTLEDIRAARRTAIEAAKQTDLAPLKIFPLHFLIVDPPAAPVVVGTYDGLTLTMQPYTTLTPPSDGQE